MHTLCVIYYINIWTRSTCFQITKNCIAIAFFLLYFIFVFKICFMYVKSIVQVQWNQTGMYIYIRCICVIYASYTCFIQTYICCIPIGLTLEKLRSAQMVIAIFLFEKLIKFPYNDFRTVFVLYIVLNTYYLHGTYI